jgi:Dihaem cytochrome c
MPHPASHAILAVTLVLAGPARAEEGVAIPPVTDTEALTECSACHIAYPPGLLPSRAWQAIMADLTNHFGENASLSPEAAKRIEAYLVANSADTLGYTGVLRGVDPAKPPLRITAMPWWRAVHEGEISPATFADPRVGSKANCAACHRGAQRGLFGEE